MTESLSIRAARTLRRMASALERGDCEAVQVDQARDVEPIERPGESWSRSRIGLRHFSLAFKDAEFDSIT